MDKIAKVVVGVGKKRRLSPASLPEALLHYCYHYYEYISDRNHSLELSKNQNISCPRTSFLPLHRVDLSTSSLPFFLSLTMRTPFHSFRPCPSACRFAQLQRLKLRNRPHAGRALRCDKHSWRVSGQPRLLTPYFVPDTLLYSVLRRINSTFQVLSVRSAGTAHGIRNSDH